jgi:hypothetical protein
MGKGHGSFLLTAYKSSTGQYDGTSKADITVPSREKTE